MPLVVPNGFGQIHFVWSLTGDPEEMITSVGFKSEVGDTSGDLQNASGVIHDQFEEHVLDGSDAATIQDAWTFVGTRSEWVDGGGVGGGIERVSNIVGTSDDGTIPNNGSLLVKKQSGLPGRSQRGRFYFPPFNLAEGEVNNNGMIDTTLLGVLNTRFGDWLSACIAGDAPMYILHTALLEAPTQIFDLIVENQIGSQRRRLRH